MRQSVPPPPSAPARIAEHHAAGRIRVDGRRVADLDVPAPPPARVVAWGE